MKLELEFTRDREGAYPSVFRINGTEAYDDDFGETDLEGDGEWGVLSGTFEINQPSADILLYYGISEAEYYEIAEKLKQGLTFGGDL